MVQSSIPDLLAKAAIDLNSYETLYKHLHSHPELSWQEKETSKTAADFLSSLKVYEVHAHIGGYGLVGVLKNGPGKIVMLRSDLDGLPVFEKTNLPYASKVKMIDASGRERPVMHACGHDMHITCLLAAAEVMAKTKELWSGTLIVLFQPAEERGTGAKAMVDDGLYNRIPVPDYVLGQHVVAMRAGKIGCRPGTIMVAADGCKVTLYGRGGHGSMPNRTVDPAVMAANVVIRLQNIVSREIDPNDFAVVTVGYIHVGETENIIAEYAEIGIDIRTVSPEIRGKVLAAVRRIVKGECIASGATKEPLIEMSREFPATYNNSDMVEKLGRSFTEHFGGDYDPDVPRTNASEDFSYLATSQDRPALFWFIGGVDGDLWDAKEKEGRLNEDIPVNHAPGYAPVIQPTMKVGIRALCLAATTFLKETAAEK